MHRHCCFRVAVDSQVLAGSLVRVLCVYDHDPVKCRVMMAETDTEGSTVNANHLVPVYIHQNGPYKIYGLRDW